MHGVGDVGLLEPCKTQNNKRGREVERSRGRERSREVERESQSARQTHRQEWIVCWLLTHTSCFLHVSFRQSNIAMTGPIMSRFDLFFVIVDECNEVTDYNIARHITSMHRLTDNAVETVYTTDEV